MSQDSPPRLSLGITISLFAYLFFITASTLVWHLRSRIPIVEVVFLMNAVCFLCILPIALRKGVRRLKTEVLTIHLVRDVFGVVSYYLYYVTIRFLSLVDATTLNYTAPFFIPFIWWIWLKERVSGHVWWSIIIGFIGVAIILNPSKEIFQIGFVFGLFAGITSAIALASLRVLNLKKEPMSRTLFYFFLAGALLSFPFAWAQWITPHTADWMRMMGVGLATFCGQILLTIAYRYGTAAYLSPLSYSTVLYAGLISFFLFEKPLSFRTLLGAILIVIGGSLSYLFQKKPEKLSDAFKAPQPKGEPPL